MKTELKKIWENRIFRRSLKTISLSVVLLIVLFLFFPLPGRKQLPSQAVMFRTMSALGTVQFFLPEKNDFSKAFQCTQESIKQVEQLCNLADVNSELSRLNATAAREPFHCSDLLWQMLMKARDLYEKTDGMFDVSCGTLSKLWNDCGKKHVFPDDSAIRIAREKSGFHTLVFDESAHTVTFTVPGTVLDFGGFMRGFAADYAAENLKSLNCTRGFIEIGDTALALPDSPPYRKRKGKWRLPTWDECLMISGIRYVPYTVSIPNPLSAENGVGCGIVKIRKEAVSTMGNLVINKKIGNKYFGYSVNPKTGKALEGSLAATVIASCGSEAQAFSFAVVSGGAEYAIRLAEKNPSVRILYYRIDSAKGNEIRKYAIGEGFDCSIPQWPSMESGEKSMFPAMNSNEPAAVYSPGKEEFSPNKK